MSDDWINDLDKHRKQVFSQCWEDGILERIFEGMGTTNGYFVDVGARDGLNGSNTANLRLNQEWNGLLLDKKSKAGVVHQEYITAENINDIFKKYQVPMDFDLLSIDIDGNDYWIWKALEYNPRVVVIEFNPNFSYDVAKTIKYNPEHIWDGTNYYGASLLALKLLGNEKGYNLIYQADYVNAFFIQKKIIDIDIPIKEIFQKTFPAHKPDTKNREWMVIKTDN